MTRVLWALFLVSVSAVAYLSLSGARSRAPGPVGEPHFTANVSREPPRPLSRAQASEGSARATAEGPAEGAGAAEATRGEAPAVSAGPRPAPAEFMASLIELAKKGDVLALSDRLSPGIARISGGLLLLVAAAQVDSTRLEEVLGNLSFEFEELGDGPVRVHVKGPDEKGPPEAIYLVPEGDSWRLVAESDLPGPAADFRWALNRLRLLAVCQHAYFVEDLGGAAGYAGSTYELALGLDRSPLYEGVVDPGLIAAVDRGIPLEGYTFGPVEGGGGGFAYFAAPVYYGADSRETLLIDGQGRVWAKDLGGEPPPTRWPGPDPAEQGWSRRGTTWR